MHRLGVVYLAVALLAAGCGSSTTSEVNPNQNTPGIAVWNGLGARLFAWELAHPRGKAGCSAGKCFGSKVQVGPGESQYEFVSVSTTPEGRVDGYTQALGGDEVIPGAAKHIVLALFPHDTRVLETYVGHENGACEIINVKSKTLGHWFANPKVGGGSGIISIDIHGTNENGESTYPRELSRAEVGLGPTHRGTAC